VADHELRAWVRGTQSLIARFQADYERALGLVRDERQYATKGTSAPRVLCGEAQCLANLGDSSGANKALDAAQDAREQADEPDSISGLFTFSETKQHYYAGSSLIWLDGGPDAERAAREASQAITMWQQEPAETRSLDDEALGHIYLGIARLKLAELDGAHEAIRPILDLPPERRISWIGKRLEQFASLLSRQPYTRSPLAGEVRDEIREFTTGDG
jgi:tetratricopeptide (TPR) repeat protein